MTAAAPWSVKGIDPRAREAAKDLARRANMTLGEWLNRVILEDETAPAPAPGRVRGIAPGAGKPARALARGANMLLGEWLNRVIGGEEPAPAPAAFPEPQAAAPRSAAGEPSRQSGDRILAPEHPADEV